MGLREEVAEAIAVAFGMEADEAPWFMDEADAAIGALAAHLAVSTGSPASWDELKGRLALAEAQLESCRAFRARDEAAEREFLARAEALVCGTDRVDLTIDRLQEATAAAVDAIWTLAARVALLDPSGTASPR